MTSSEVGNPYDELETSTRDAMAQVLWQRSFDPSALSDDVAAAMLEPKNSEAAFLERMQRYLRHLIDHPLSHTRNDRKSYEAMLEHVQALSPLQTYVLRSLLGGNANQGYEPVSASDTFDFPADHAPQLSFQTGWHFFVGSCWDADGQEYGVEVMFFGMSTFPPEQAAEYGLSPLDNQLYEIQFAISTEGERHRQADPVVIAGTSGLISYSADPEPFSFRIGNDVIESHQPGHLFPMTLRAWGMDVGDAEPVELMIDFTFTSGREYLIQGVDGCMPCVDGLGSRYYSIPEIQIGSPSKLRVGDREVEVVRGDFWMDHQWGFLSGQPASPALRAANNIAEPEPIGWDWFMAQFVGNRQITMAAPHRKARAEFYQQTGDEPPGTMSVRVGGTYLDENMGSTIVFGTLDVDGWIKTELSPNPDRYPATFTWYPNHWSFRFEHLPGDIAEFTMTPIVDTGQAAFFANGAQISEGAVFLRDPDGTDIGRGFAESVMYADPVRTQLRIVGLPETDEMVDLVTPGAPRLLTRLENLLYSFTHKKELQHVFDDAKGMEFFPSD